MYIYIYIYIYINYNVQYVVKLTRGSEFLESFTASVSSTFNSSVLSSLIDTACQVNTISSSCIDRLSPVQPTSARCLHVGLIVVATLWSISTTNVYFCMHEKIVDGLQYFHTSKDSNRVRAVPQLNIQSIYRLRGKLSYGKGYLFMEWVYIFL